MTEAQYEYLASHRVLEDLQEECSSTIDYLAFVGENVKYFRGNLEKDVCLRRQESATFRHRGLAAFRQAFGDYVEIITHQWMEAAHHAVAHSEAVLVEIRMKSSSLLQQIGKVMSSRKQQLDTRIAGLNELSESTMKSQQQLNHLQHQLYIDSREPMRLGNAKCLALGISAQRRAEIESLRQEIAISSRERSKQQEFVRQLEGCLEEDYRFHARLIKKDIGKANDKLQELCTIISDKADSSLYAGMNFSKMRNWLAEEEENPEADLLEQFLRDEEKLAATCRAAPEAPPLNAVPKIAELGNLRNILSTKDLLFCQQEILGEAREMVVPVMGRHFEHTTSSVERSGYNEDQEEQMLSEQDSFSGPPSDLQLGATVQIEFGSKGRQCNQLRLDSLAANSNRDIVSLHSSINPSQHGEHTDRIECSQPVEHVWQRSEFVIDEAAGGLKQDVSESQVSSEAPAQTGRFGSERVEASRAQQVLSWKVYSQQSMSGEFHELGKD